MVAVLGSSITLQGSPNAYVSQGGSGKNIRRSFCYDYGGLFMSTAAIISDVVILTTSSGLILARISQASRRCRHQVRKRHVADPTRRHGPGRAVDTIRAWLRVLAYRLGRSGGASVAATSVH
ncbi:MAG: hypothetical protein EXR01_03550 [Acetobacteraceae bacterium]|nr:hypothetical protein [Acetobacteraceae bacterium]